MTHSGMNYGILKAGRRRWLPFVGTDLAAVLFAVLHGTLTVLRAHAPGLWTQRSRMLRAESMVAWEMTVCKSFVCIQTN